MDVLVAFRIKVRNSDHDYSSSLRRLSADADNSSVSEISSSSSPEMAEDEINGSSFTAATNDQEHQLAHLEILDGDSTDVKEEDLKLSKEELKNVEERLKTAFIEFSFLSSVDFVYLIISSFMNLSSFSKILKEYEKIATRKAARSYMRAVDNSYLGSSDEVDGLLNRVEASTFIKNFANSKRKKGMKLLRPKHKKQKHHTTFFSGFFSGLAIALLIAAVLVIGAKRLIDRKEGNLYMDNIFELYSFYAYIVLHMLLYAANIYFWRRYRINYPYIFGFRRESELGYREVFLLSNGLAMLVLGTFLAHVYIKMESRSQDQRSNSFL